MGGRTFAYTSTALGAALGVFTWTATEYATHRWVLHGPFGRGRLARVPLGGLHRAHHRAPLHSSLAARGAGHICVAAVAAAIGTGLATTIPTAMAKSAAVAWSGGYSTYEITHWNLHHRSARTQIGQRMRDRHHRHHFGAPASNLGVTMSFWDHIFGTEAVASNDATDE